MRVHAGNKGTRCETVTASATVRRTTLRLCHREIGKAGAAEEFESGDLPHRVEQSFFRRKGGCLLPALKAWEASGPPRAAFFICKREGRQIMGMMF